MTRTPHETLKANLLARAEEKIGTTTYQRVKSPNVTHCELCARRNPITDQGYTSCCNEPTCDAIGCATIIITHEEGWKEPLHFRTRDALEAFLEEQDMTEETR